MLAHLPLPPFLMLYYQRFRVQGSKSEALIGKPKGMLESEIRIAMLLLEQRPPRYAGAGRFWSIAEAKECRDEMFYGRKTAISEPKGVNGLN